jgi:hypothetical protein
MEEGENGRGFEEETGEWERERMGEGVKGRPVNEDWRTGNANANSKHRFLIIGFSVGNQ